MNAGVDFVRTKMSKRAMSAFKDRYERNHVIEMTPEQWGEWVNGLPISEFMAMMDLHDTRKTRPKGAQIDRDELCKQLAGIAAFQLFNKPVAQGIINEAIRAIQGGNN